MAPRVLENGKPSPLTKSKILVAFKGIKPKNLGIQEVVSLGERYLQKQTSIRRFSASFSQLRLDHRRVKNCRNTELVKNWEKEIFIWPAKDDPPELEILAIDEGGEEESEVTVTMSGRATGRQ